MPNRMRLLTSVLLLLAVSQAAVSQAAVSDEGAPLPLRRWFGAEGLFQEVSCWGPATQCESFTSVGTFDGRVDTLNTRAGVQDPDGVVRPWPARTGNRLFHASVPGGAPAVAYLSTIGAFPGATAPVTTSFGLSFHVLPTQPVVVYRHVGATPAQTVMLTLTPEGSLALSSSGVVGVSQPLTLLDWHNVTITYGGGKTVDRLKLYVDGQVPLEGTLGLPAPSAEIEVGIVTPVTSGFSLGFDDYVEVAGFDLPVRGARINYLIPHGKAGKAEWGKAYPDENCREAAKNWQLVSEDQFEYVDDYYNGVPGWCSLTGGGVITDAAGAQDDYKTEGIPSIHKSSGFYVRDIYAQPDSFSTILGVRMRISAFTSGPVLTMSLGYVTAGHEVMDQFSFGDGGSGTPITAWGPTHMVRPNGDPWTSTALNEASLRLDSGTSPTGTRHVQVVRLDYVWVP